MQVKILKTAQKFSKKNIENFVEIILLRINIIHEK